MSDQHNADEVFIHLVFGLQTYVDSKRTIISNSFRHALNAMSFKQRLGFPKTLNGVIMLCHEPINNWYPYDISPKFNATQALLYDSRLSEEAEEYCLDLSELLGLSERFRGNIPQIALDNLHMVNFRQRLKGEPDQIEAQRLYVEVRSFLISHSWTTLDILRDQSYALRQELKVFYDEMPSLAFKEIPVCDHCGILVWENNQWKGVKPKYCSDHGNGSTQIHMIRNVPQIYRQKRGIHLRTFIPGRIELQLFELAEELDTQFQSFLSSVERYPGLDTYDLRLSFIDGEVWAIDAKDHVDPRQLAGQIHSLHGEGELHYTTCFYVIPDERMERGEYSDLLKNALSHSSTNLFVVSFSEFQKRFEAKLKSFMRSHKSRKQN